MQVRKRDSMAILCVFHFKTTIGVIREVTLKYLNLKKKVHPANILSVSRILSKTLFQFVSGLQNAKQHWSEDWILDVTALAKVMTRKRFLDLLYSIHINDNSKMTAAGSDQYNKL